MLVAAMISSAGSDLKSKAVLFRAIWTVIGIIVRWRSERQNATLSMLRSKRPSWTSFANSQSTISDTAKLSFVTKAFPLGQITGQCGDQDVRIKIEHSIWPLSRRDRPISLSLLSSNLSDPNYPPGRKG